MRVVQIQCDDGTARCGRCGFKTACRNKVYHKCKAPAGLGDLVAAGLSAIGITEERAQKVARAVGLSGCGCAGRKAALNSLSDRLLGRVEGKSQETA